MLSGAVRGAGAHAESDKGSAIPVTANALAARVDHHYNALRSLQVEFVQQYDGMGLHRRESGTLLLSKPGRMRWTYAEPEGKLFVLDGHNGYFYSPGETEVQRVPAKRLDDLRSPLRFLLGRTRLAKELSGLSLSAAQQSAPVGSGPDAGGLFVLSGTPVGMEQRVSSFQITAAPDGTIRAIRIEETDGAVTSFSFTREQPNAPVAEAVFVFKAPPGTSIVDGLPPV